MRSLFYRHKMKNIFYKKNVFLPKRTCEHLKLKETKNVTLFILLKAHPHELC